MDRLVSTIWLCTSSFGGLLAIPAVPPYAWGVVIPIAFSSVAYRDLTNATSRKIFLFTAAAVLLIGVAIGQLCFTANALSSTGMVLALLTFGGSLVSIWRIWVLEKGTSR